MESSLALCAQVVQEAFTPLVYSHVIVFTFTVFFGYLIGRTGENKLLAEPFTLICIGLLVWLGLDTITWIGYHSPLLMQVAWAPMEIVATLLFVGTFYFTYAYINERKPSKELLFRLGLICLPILLFAPTSYYMTGYDYVDCLVIENEFYINYVLLVKGIISLSAFIVLFRAWKLKIKPRRDIAVMLLGITGFLVAYGLGSFVSSYLDDYIFDLYGLFGFIVFLGALSYLVSRKHIFNSKVFTAQIVMGFLVSILIPRAFFIVSQSDAVLWGIELVVTIVIGAILVNSVREEIRQRELLAAANVELERLNVQKSEFLSFATHQLSSPLTSLKWGIESLLDPNIEGEKIANQQGVLNQLHGTVIRMIHVVRDFLAVSKLEQDGLTLSKSATSVNEFVTKIVHDYIPLAVQKGLSIEARILDIDSTADIDSVKLEQVLAIFIDNAIKYSPQGAIVVSAEKHDNMVLISVIDQGKGIEVGEEEKLFNKFARGSSAGENKSGSGIGLYLAKEIIALHGGSVGAKRNEIGQGSTFWFTVPV